MYRELQDAIYLIKQAANNFTGQLIIEVEDDDGDTPAIDNAAAQRSGFDSFQDRMEQNYSYKGEDPASILVTSRPMGARPMFVFQVKPNTNEGWYKVTGEISEAKILISHGVTRRFMGFDVASGLATDQTISDYIFNVEPVINDHRATIMNFINLIISFAWEQVGKPELSKYSITFRSPIQSTVEDYKQRSNGSQNNNNPVGGSEVQPSGT